MTRCYCNSNTKAVGQSVKFNDSPILKHHVMLHMDMIKFQRQIQQLNFVQCLWPFDSGLKVKPLPFIMFSQSYHQNKNISLEYVSHLINLQSLLILFLVETSLFTT